MQTGLSRGSLNLTQRCRELTVEINALETEITTLVEQLAPSLLAICGCGPLTAAKIVGETAGVERFRTKDAFARHNGTAPLPVWSSNSVRHRLSRTGNRQLNAALHRTAITQARWHPEARALLARRKAGGDGGLEAIRVLKRRLSDIVYRASSTTRTPYNDSLLDRGASDGPVRPRLSAASRSRQQFVVVCVFECGCRLIDERSGSSRSIG